MLDRIKTLCLRFEPVGSRVTCVPAPTDTDADYLLLVEDHSSFRIAIGEFYFTMDGSEVVDSLTPLDSADRFSSYSLGYINLIVTSDVVFFDKFMAATSVAKWLNLLDKQDRIVLFQAVLYGNPCV